MNNFSFSKLMGLLCLLLTSYSIKAQVDSLQIAGHSFCQRSLQPIQGLVLSEEVGFLDGNFQLHFDLDVLLDSIEIIEPIEVQFPIENGVSVFQNIQLPNLTDIYFANDDITSNIPISYDINDLPYYPQEVQISIAYNNLINGTNKVLKLYAYVYFTPYNTIEIWNPADFYGQRRVWIEPYGNEPQRRYIARDSIPTSNLPLHPDSLHVWEEDWNYELIDGLAYAIPFKRLNQEEADDNQKADGCWWFRQRFIYNMTGRLLGENFDRKDIVAALDEVPLAELEIKLYEDDFDIFDVEVPGVLDDQLFDATITDDDGFFDMSFNRCQTIATEGDDIELFLVIKAHSPTHDIKAKSWITGSTWQNLPFFTRRAVIVLGDFPYLDGNEGTIPFSEFEIGDDAHKSVSYCKLAMDFVNESLSEEIPGSFTIWPDAFGTSFFFPSNLGFLDWTPYGLPSILNMDGKPAIYLDADSSGEEDVTYHEFGHYLMWQLQNKYWIDPLTGSFANHAMRQESNARIAWTEGWANAFAVIADMVFFEIDEEYDTDRFNNNLGDVFRFEVNPNHPAVNRGYLSEHYFASVVNDLFDGPNMYSFNIPTARTFDDSGSNAWTTRGELENQIELSFQEICQPIIDNAGLCCKLHDTDDYYRELIKGRGCHERREIKRIFDNNGVTDLTMAVNPGFSSDAIGFNNNLNFTETLIPGIEIGEINLDIEDIVTVTFDEDFFLDAEITSTSPLPSFNMGYSTNASTWLSDDLLIENNGSLTFNANTELDNVLVDIAPLYTPQALIQPFFLFPQPEAHIEVDLCGGMNMTIGNDGFVTLGDNGIATTAEVRVNADSKVIAKYSVEKAVFYHLQNRHTEALNVLRKLNYHRTIPFCLI